MFGRSLTLFSVFGIEVKVNLGWALIALFIAWSLAQGLFPALYEGLETTTYWAMAVVAIIGLAISIVLHELSHSLVARLFGMEVKSITLFLFGGVAALERDPPSAKSEFWMAIAGPAMSFLLAGFFALLAGLDGLNENLAAVFNYLSMLNMVLAVFNLIPAFPMDGGRALRAALWALRGDVRWATRIAARAGEVFGVLLMTAGLFFALMGAFVGGLWWILIGIFIRSAARGSVVQAASERAFAGQPVRRFMTTQLDTAPPDISLRAFVDEFLYRHHHDLFPVIEHGEAIGVIGRNEIKTVPPERWNETTVRQAMREISQAETVEAGSDAAEALARMQENGIGRMLVLERGRLAGVIALKDFLDVISLRMDLERV
ncbi:MAG: site-2 protease family protein [Maricaulaceae bacterium]|jgi:Zn-dependent protease/CBS domain-containing protein